MAIGREWDYITKLSGEPGKGRQDGWGITVSAVHVLQYIMNLRFLIVIRRAPNMLAYSAR